MIMITKFNDFKKNEGMAEPTVKPARPDVKPGTKPKERPGRPSPIRRDKPSVNPNPKATAEDVVKKACHLMDREYAKEIVKKYVHK